MSYRMKITLSDTAMAELERRADDAGEPVARVAARTVVAKITEDGSATSGASAASTFEETEADLDRHAPWIEPVMGDPAWRRQMWGSIVARHGRYPHALAHLKDKWWNDASHVETLCALVARIDASGEIEDLPALAAAYDALLSDETFRTAVSKATADEESVRTRMSKARDAFASLE
jgi:hypothetical protein